MIWSRFLLVFYALVVWVNVGVAQTSFDRDYRPITYNGVIPASFLVDARVKTQQELAKKDNAVEHLSAENQEEYYAVTNYLLSQAYLSGAIYFNDTITSYVQSITKQLLAQHSELYDQLEIYVSKVASPNAYSFRNGVLLVNIGLIHLLDNEDELAFVLGHEIEHYVDQHVLKSFTKRKSYTRSGWNRGFQWNKQLQLLEYSRIHEMEADAGGMAFLLKSNFNNGGGVAALEKLKSAWPDQHSNVLPLCDIFVDGEDNCDTALFTRMLSKMTYWKEKEIEAAEADTMLEESVENEELWSTHPDIDVRISALKSMDTVGVETRKKYTGSKSYQYVKEVVKFELIQRYFDLADYGRALYETLQLLQEYPNNIWLNEMSARCSAWIIYYEHINKEEKVLHLWGRYKPTPYAGFLYFMRKLRRDKSKTMLSLYLNKLQQKFPNNERILLAQAQALECEGDASAVLEAYNYLITTFPASEWFAFYHARKSRYE